MSDQLNRLQMRMEVLTESDTCIAFSGGVDSSLLLKTAAMAAEKNYTKVYAVTISTRLQPWEDTNIARRVAAEFGAEHHVLVIDESKNEEILKNSNRRCYWCKRFLFQSLKNWASGKGVGIILEGSNADDMQMYRPGLKAVAELDVISPLADLGITKKQVRQMAEELSISVANRPASPCMATRIPYDTPLDFAAMDRLAKGERQLREMGFEVVRLRLHGDIVRVEVAKEKLGEAVDKRCEIISVLRDLDFRYITLDLEGFRSGSMDLW